MRREVASQVRDTILLGRVRRQRPEGSARAAGTRRTARF